MLFLKAHKNPNSKGNHFVTNFISLFEQLYFKILLTAKALILKHLLIKQTGCQPEKVSFQQKEEKGLIFNSILEMSTEM